MKIKITIKVPRKKRAHQALFDGNLPFKPKVEKNKKAFKRNKKHKKQQDQ